MLYIREYYGNARRAHYDTSMFLIDMYWNRCKCIQRRDFAGLFWQQVGLMLQVWITNCGNWGNANSGGRYIAFVLKMSVAP